MNSASQFAMVLVTTPDLKSARKLVQICLKSRLVACANLFPGVESHYRWQQKIETSSEVLIVFKTCRACLRKLEATISEHHPYEVPEFLVVPLQAGAAKYLAWLESECRPKERDEACRRALASADSR